MAKVEYSAVGRRKKAVARVRLVAGDGKIVINKRDIDDYFGLETLKMTVRQPLNLTNIGNFDVMVNVKGGGLKETKYRKLMAEKPEFAVRHAVVGMLPKGPLGRQMAKKLKVYAGAEHDQAAQKPEVLDLK